MASQREISEKEAVVIVTSTVVGNQTQKGKKIKIRPFVTATATVSVKYGLTIPLEAYASARVDVMISTPCYVEEVPEVYEQVKALVDRLVEVEANKINGDP